MRDVLCRPDLSYRLPQASQEIYSWITSPGEEHMEVHLVEEAKDPAKLCRQEEVKEKD